MRHSFPSWQRKDLVDSMGEYLRKDEATNICAECNGTGFILYKNVDGYEYAKPCQCTLIKEARERLLKSGLAKEFQAKTFDDFKTCKSPVLEDAKSTVLQYTDNFFANQDLSGNSLMLCGQVGAGKTHLGTACSMRLIDEGIPVIYMGYREAITALKANVTDSSIYQKELQKYKSAQVLFIDDFLKGKITEADVNIVYEIVNHRYNNRLPIILSTEKNLDDLIRFDEAIASRLIEMCRGHIVVFQGGSLNYRLYRGGVA